MNKKPGKIKKAIEYSLAFVAIFWVIQVIKYLTGSTLAGLGILPRSVDGLLGVVTAPLIHANFEHLIANTLPFFFLSCLLFIFYEKKASLYLVVIWITTGIITWIIGRYASDMGYYSHIGASGVIYGLASFLVFGGILSKNWKLILVSILVLVFYSGLIWGMFPTESHVSWEGHLAGALSGLLWVFLFRKTLHRAI